jgi:hypothetical protein
MLTIQRLVTAACLLGLVVAGCGGDDVEGADGVADAGGSEPIDPSSGDTEASDDDTAMEVDTAMAVAPTDEEVASACSAYCVYETETCPDTSADAVNDIDACEAACMDASNASGLAGSAAESADCYMQTSAYFTCLEGLSCEDFDAHLAGINTDPEYVDACTETLADDACL